MLSTGRSEVSTATYATDPVSNRSEHASYAPCQVVSPASSLKPSKTAPSTNLIALTDIDAVNSTSIADDEDAPNHPALHRNSMNGWKFLFFGLFIVIVTVVGIILNISIALYTRSLENNYTLLSLPNQANTYGEPVLLMELQGRKHSKVQATLTDNQDFIQFDHVKIALSDSVATEAVSKKVTSVLKSGPATDKVYAHGNFKYLTSISSHESFSIYVQWENEEGRLENICSEAVNDKIYDCYHDRSGYYQVFFTNVPQNHLSTTEVISGTLDYDAIDTQNSTILSFCLPTPKCSFDLSQKENGYSLLAIVRVTDNDNTYHLTVKANSRSIYYVYIEIPLLVVISILLLVCFYTTCKQLLCHCDRSRYQQL